jgi:hypothetical protein
MASQSTAFPSTTATLLVGWANQQDAWIRGVAQMVLETGTPLADDELAALYEQFLVEKQLRPGIPSDVPLLSVPANEAGIGKPLKLISLKEIQNVNALAPGQTINFNPKLTIIFGENAAGKSLTCTRISQAHPLRSSTALRATKPAP